MIKVCFIILHHNTLEVTQKCITSILKLEEQDKIAVVIVDNASPDGSGRILADQYGENDRTKIILKETNDGFSVGNNDGCIFAMSEWNYWDCGVFCPSLHIRNKSPVSVQEAFL